MRFSPSYSTLSCIVQLKGKSTELMTINEYFLTHKLGDTATRRI